jgi:hypothetical protein
MKAAIISMLGNVGTTLNSQGGGYGLICTKMVKDYNELEQLDVNPDPSTWSQYDMLYVCEGVNFTGSFNIPGGIQPEHVEKMKAIADYKGDLQFVNKAFDFDMFNQKRVKLEGAQFKQARVVDYFYETAQQTKKIVIGDSHALSVWKPGYGLSFNPGKTLYGWLKTANAEELNKYDEVILYFGNIDLRFHLCRQDIPVDAAIELFEQYIQFCKSLTCDVTLVELLPIEHESRKIPGTGLYKGQPFYGSRNLRMHLREVINHVIRNNGLKTLSWPNEWVDEDGTKMMNEVLEQKQSVHIRPKHYRYITDITCSSK